MRYKLDCMSKETGYEYKTPTAVIPFNAEDIVEVTESALQIARYLRARKQTGKWAVRITNSTGTTALSITSEM